MGESKKIKGKVLHKHEVEEIWDYANYTPGAGEIVIYDAEYDEDGQIVKPARQKIGDGKSLVRDLPFSSIDGLSGTIYGDSCFALGTTTVSGTRGYKVIGTIGERDQPGTYMLEEFPEDLYNYINSIGGSADNCASLGIKYSIFLQYNGYSYGTITALEPSSNGIAVDKMFYAPSWETRDDAWKNQYFESSYLYIPDHPEFGFKEYGNGSFAEGYETKATLIGAHAEGTQTTAEGKYSHAEGRLTYAGYAGHAEGYRTEARAQYAHSEGYETKATGDASHAEGSGSQAKGNYSHAEGVGTQAIGSISHAEGSNSIASGNNAHAEGQKDFNYNSTPVTASGAGSHAEGAGTTASGKASHAEGHITIASGDYSHAEGQRAEAKGAGSHAENAAKAYAPNSHAEGNSTAEGDSYHYMHAEGHTTKATGGHGAHSEGHLATANGQAAHAEGYKTVAVGRDAHAEGNETYAIQNAHSEGSYTFAVGGNSHAEGGGGYHPELQGKSVSEINTYWQNNKNIQAASGANAHVEGNNNLASGTNAHAEGRGNGALGESSHAGGTNSTASHANSFVHGEGLKTSRSHQTVVGKYNKNSENALFVVGNGNSDTDAGRKNAFEARLDGCYDATGQKLLTQKDLEKKTYAHVLDLKKNGYYDGQFYYIDNSPEPIDTLPLNKDLFCNHTSDSGISLLKLYFYRQVAGDAEFNYVIRTYIDYNGEITTETIDFSPASYSVTDMVYECDGLYEHSLKILDHSWSIINECHYNKSLISSLPFPFKNIMLIWLSEEITNAPLYQGYYHRNGPDPTPEELESEYAYLCTDHLIFSVEIVSNSITYKFVDSISPLTFIEHHGTVDGYGVHVTDTVRKLEQ